MVKEEVDTNYTGTIAGLTTSAFVPDKITAYTFDLVGNRKTQKIDANGDGDYTDTTDQTIKYTYDADNRLTDEDLYYRHEHGRPTSRPITSTAGLAIPARSLRAMVITGGECSTTTYTYNVQGQMASATVDGFDQILHLRRQRQSDRQDRHCWHDRVRHRYQ